MNPSRQHSRTKWKTTVIVIGSLLAAVLAACLVFFFQPAYTPNAATRSLIRQVIKKQEQIEKNLQAYYLEGSFSFQDPLVVQDPYQVSPLTALVIFDTVQPSQVSVHVPGKTSQADVDFTFPSYSLHHEIPIYGLYAGDVNRVQLTLTGQDGSTDGKELELQTEPLPVTLPAIQVGSADAQATNPGFNLAYLDAKPIFDLQGQVRWYSSRDSLFVCAPLANGHTLFTYGKDENIIMEQDLLGKVYAVYTIPDGIHHDIYELPSGNLLVTTQDLKARTVEDLLLEVERSSGHTVHSFDLKKVLDASRQHVMGVADNDWLHLNSVVYDPADASIIVSSKGQSAVVKLGYPEMDLRWILGTPEGWTSRFQSSLLSPQGENFKWFWSQHHATLYGADVPSDGKLDILLFDNGVYRSFNPSEAASPPEWYSRLVHYRVYEDERKVEQVWEFGQQLGLGNYTMNQGGAQLLPNGNVLGTWSAIAHDKQGNPVTKIASGDYYETRILEVNPATNQVVFDVRIPMNSAYRTLRLGLYDNYAAGPYALQAGVNDTSRSDLVDRAWFAWRDIQRWSNEVPVLLQVKRFVRRLF